MLQAAIVCTHCGRDRAGKQRRPGVSDEPPSASAHLAAGERACPWCAEPIKTAALVCKHCGKSVQGVTASSAKNAPMLTLVLAAVLAGGLYTWFNRERPGAAPKPVSAYSRSATATPSPAPAERIGRHQPSEAERAAASAELDREVMRRQLRDIDQISQRWSDAFSLANSAPRISLAGPMATLQGIRREALQVAVPDCLANGKRALVGAMDESNEALMAFMRDPGEETQRRNETRFGRANTLLAEYKAARERCLQ